MKANSSANAEFSERLGRFKRAWKRSLSVALFLRLAGWTVAALAVYFAADFFLAFGETARAALNVLLPVSLAAAAAPEAIRIARLGMGAAAEWTDRIGKHRRRDVLSAWELLRAGGATSAADDAGALPAFLVRRSVGAAVARLKVLETRAVRARDLLARRGRLLGAQILIALAVVAVCGPEALRSIAPRMLWPGRDLPPYSRYRFCVQPDTPLILYGGSAEVTATIRGAPVTAQVWLMTRRAGQKAQRVACFQESGDRYAQRLERVTAPVEFCFAVGRARSRWHAVELQLQPQVAQARVRLVPPPYTRSPAREFPAGQEDVAGVRGTKAILTLTSNRPLKDGTLTLLRRRALQDDAQIVAARLVSAHTAAFEWTLQENAEARAILRDVRGTAMAEPLVLRQRLAPDEAPTVLLAEPPDFSMATTSAVVRMAGNAEDDFGLERLDWIRAVVGFNDRVLTLRRGPGSARSEFETELNLGRLGVAVGQILEFYVEALDNNPYLAGVSASRVARVKVISDEDYAETIRNREAVEQFAARYSAAMEALNRVIASLDDLQTLVRLNPPDRAVLAAAVRKCREAHTAAEGLFSTLARDFAAYDSEKILRQTAGSILGKLAENKADLEVVLDSGSDQAARVDKLLKRFDADAASLRQQAGIAHWVAQAAKVMDGAARFQALVQRQDILVRRLKQRFGATVAAADRQFLPGYGEEQEGIAKELGEFAAEVSTAAEALPDVMASLKTDTREFLLALEQTGASNHMTRAANASRNSDARNTLREAQLALEKLRSLLRADSAIAGNCFAGMCRGQQPDFGPDAGKETLREMFRALCRKRGIGAGPGPGIGRGGAGSGYGVEGYSELGTPVYGPERSSLGRTGEGRGMLGEGRGSDRRPVVQGAAVAERLAGARAPAASGEAIQFERLPLKYREAVKRYFQSGREGGER
jgi:hypothetical protein